jgi:hypothetical protein
MSERERAVAAGLISSMFIDAHRDGTSEKVANLFWDKEWIAAVQVRTRHREADDEGNRCD